MRARDLGVILAVSAVLITGCTSAAGAGPRPTANDASASGSPASSAPSPASSAPSPESSAPTPPDTPTLFETTRAELLAVEADRGVAPALQLLERRIDDAPALAGVCHAIAHELGHEAVELAGGRARAALRHGTEVCGGGFIHGVIETVLGSSTNPGRDLLRVCTPSNAGSCFHGVGHGLMFATEMSVRASLDLCDRAPNRELSARCGEGVFMQLFSSDLSAQHVAGEESLDISHDPDAAQSRCRATRPAYAANCWFYAPTVYLTVHPDDFSGALRWCRDAGTYLGRQLCARGVGSRSVKYHPDDLSVADATCSAAAGLTDSCLQGMGSYWSVHNKGKVEPRDVCEHLDPSPLKKRCRAVV